MSRFGPQRRCIALYDYTAQDDEELTIEKNQKLTVLNSDGPWWLVTNDRGKQGLVPCNYVKELPAGSGAMQSSVIRHVPEEPLGMYQQTDLVMPSNGPALNIRAVAKYRYVSTREDELGLEKGDEIVVLEKEADGWWRGRSGSRIGWFPFNYVEEIKGETFAASSSASPSQMQVPSVAPTKKDKQFICGVVALYSFNSGNQEELAFQKGDLMDIIDQPSDDPDWWEARKPDGTTGLIPRNYVEVVHDAEPVTASGRMDKTKLSQAMGGGSHSPISGLSNPPPFAHEMWYHGKMSRKDADRLLEQYGQNGQFLVRDSETKVSYWTIG